MPSCWSAAAIMPIYIRSNCSKKSWNANERLPGRRGFRKGLRFATLAAADGLFAAVPGERCLRGVFDAAGRAARSRRALLVRVRGGQVYRTRDEWFASRGGGRTR